MPIEFLGMGATHDGTETSPRSGGSFDADYTVRLARAHQDHGWDRVLTAYGSGSPDPGQAAALIATHTDSLQILVAHRPNLSIPTFAAKTLATLDHISDGRVTVHMITGGSDHEQQREGDFLTKDQRYGRTREYIQILKQAWTRHEPFDYAGEHYRFADFVSDVFPVQQPRPAISFGGSSDAAYAVGTAEADIFCLWGEPLADTREQIDRVRAEAAAAGRADPPRIQVAFRPILAPTERQAWEKAEEIVRRITSRKAGRSAVPAGSRSSGEHRLPAAAGDRRAGRPARQDPLLRHGQGHRRSWQLQRPGRHPRAGGRSAAGLRRPGRGHHLGARLRHAAGRDRLRRPGHPAGPRRGRASRSGGRLTRRTT